MIKQQVDKTEKEYSPDRRSRPPIPCADPTRLDFPVQAGQFFDLSDRPEAKDPPARDPCAITPLSPRPSAERESRGPFCKKTGSRLSLRSAGMTPRNLCKARASQDYCGDPSPHGVAVMPLLSTKLPSVCFAGNWRTRIGANQFMFAWAQLQA